MLQSLLTPQLMNSINSRLFTHWDTSGTLENIYSIPNLIFPIKQSNKFSKFIKPDSIRIDLKISDYDKKNLDAIAFKTPDDKFVVVLLNRNSSQSFSVRIKDPVRPLNSATVNVDPNSIYTLIWKK